MQFFLPSCALDYGLQNAPKKFEGPALFFVEKKERITEGKK
jgi:hypothetical protein